VRLRGQMDFDAVTGPDQAAGQDNGHDARFAYEIALLVASQRCAHEAGLDAVELSTGVTESSHFDDGGWANRETSACGKREQIDTTSGDVLTHDARRDGETGRRKLIVKLGGDQVHLAEIGQAWVSRYSRAVLDGRSEVGVAVYAKTGEELNRRPNGL
jgi:hypothetical protein